MNFEDLLKREKKKNYYLFYKKNFPNLKNDIYNLVSYDRQAGTYIDFYKTNKGKIIYSRYCRELYSVMFPFLKKKQNILEVGTGECVTLLGLSKIIINKFSEISFFGFDFSFSRLLLGKKFIENNKIYPTLFLSSMEKIPLIDGCIDIVFSSHSLEPNGGKEEVIIKECLRISNKYVFLFEPIYELNPKKNQSRMKKFNYVRNLYKICKKLDCKIIDYRLLNYNQNSNNLTGVVILEKNDKKKKIFKYKCLLTKSTLHKKQNFFYNKKNGVIYPVIKKIPILLEKSAVIASRI
jgi:ubiquinone/menaquinone biosynthesis C-methylase UbiE